MLNGIKKGKILVCRFFFFFACKESAVPLSCTPSSVEEAVMGKTAKMGWIYAERG